MNANEHPVNPRGDYVRIQRAVAQQHLRLLDKPLHLAFNAKARTEENVKSYLLDVTLHMTVLAMRI